MAENTEYEKETLKVELEQFRFYGTFLIGLLTVIGGFIIRGEYSNINLVLISIVVLFTIAITVTMAVKIEKIYKLLEIIKLKLK